MTVVSLRYTLTYIFIKETLYHEVLAFSYCIKQPQSQIGLRASVDNFSGCKFPGMFDIQGSDIA